MAKNCLSCFVIMPFSESSKEHSEDYWNKHFNKFLKPIIEEVPNLEAHRSEPLRGDILKQIIFDLVVSTIVVADLTDHNPNVYWELGVRQSFKHNTITIAEEGTQLPFDISSKATLFYNPKDHLKMAEFRNKFKDALIDCVSKPNKPDSHVLETISGHGSFFEIFRLDEAKRRLDALLSEYNRNFNVFKEIYNNIRKNEIPTDRFHISAIELLITNRYLDENNEFYKKAEHYIEFLIVINDQLRVFEVDEKGVRKYLLGLEKEINDVFYEFKKEVEKIHKKLIERLRF